MILKIHRTHTTTLSKKYILALQATLLVLLQIGALHLRSFLVAYELIFKTPNSMVMEESGVLVELAILTWPAPL